MEIWGNYISSQKVQAIFCNSWENHISFIQNGMYDYDVFHIKVLYTELNTIKQLKLLYNVPNIYCCPSLYWASPWNYLFSIFFLMSLFYICVVNTCHYFYFWNLQHSLLCSKVNSLFLMEITLSQNKQKNLNLLILSNCFSWIWSLRFNCCHDRKTLITRVAEDTAQIQWQFFSSMLLLNGCVFSSLLTLPYPSIYFESDPKSV